MAFDAKTFNQMRSDVQNEEKWREEIKCILSGICDKKYDIVLDVGCNGGQLTALLDSEITVGHIYGIDISEDVIEFAKQNHMKDNISYIAQDFGIEFDLLVPELKALEGNVSLIFSNNVFAYIPDLKNLSHNLYRLLSKGGEIFASIGQILDLYMDLALEEMVIHEKMMKIPDPQIRFDVMFEEFKSVGFDVIPVKVFESKSTIKLKAYKQYLIPLLLRTYKQYIVATDEKSIEAVMKCLADKIIAGKSVFTDDTNGEEMVDYCHTLNVFRLKK